MPKIAVLGSGGWGTALALTALSAQNDVIVWSAFKDEADSINKSHENIKYLPGVSLPANFRVTTDMSCVLDAELVIIAVPSFAVRETVKRLADIRGGHYIVVIATKGIAADGGLRLSVMVRSELPGKNVAVLSGPSHAEEVARGIPTSVVVSSENTEASAHVQQLMSGPRFRIYVNDDVAGVELGGAIKNIIALSGGICDGLEMGDNTKAALMTRGLAEMARFGVALGARRETFYGLSGLGDLIVTCASMHSRNRRAGILIGQGMSAAEAVARVGTVEGYHAVKVIWQIAAEKGIDMPITEQCYRVCYENGDPLLSLKTLMERPKKSEHERIIT